MDKRTTITGLKHLASLISARDELDRCVTYGIDDQTEKNLISIKRKHFKGKEIGCPSLANQTFGIIKIEEKTPPFTYSTYIYATLGSALAAIAFLPQIIGWGGYFVVLLGAVLLMGILLIRKKYKLRKKRRIRC